MLVKMLEDRQVTVDGVHTIAAEAGETYEMGDGVAASLIGQDAAEPADPFLPLDAFDDAVDDELAAAWEAAHHEDAARNAADADVKEAGDAPENKDAGAAAETKQSPKKPAAKKQTVKKPA